MHHNPSSGISNENHSTSYSMHFHRPSLSHVSNPFRRRQSSTSSTSTANNTYKEHNTAPTLPRPPLIPAASYEPTLPRRDSYDPAAWVSSASAYGTDNTRQNSETERRNTLRDLREGCEKDEKEKRRKFSVCDGWMIGAEEGSVDNCIFVDHSEGFRRGSTVQTDTGEQVEK